ncbi:MAG: holin family protein [Rhodobacteraceae bacterium]|nr:holin family protein [Paracoccaceae bacterium]
MGLIRTILGMVFRPGSLVQAGQAVTQVADAFRPNATRQMELGHDAFAATQAAYAAEFQHGRAGRFDAFVNGINRLPRPALALGTLGLFCYAMVDPAGFTLRMSGLATVPEPLWWLLGAVVAFYFGARETHYRRTPASPPAPNPRPQAQSNPALAAWLAEADENRGLD